jgi:hypothetical protein
MKMKHTFILGLIILLFSCGGSGDDEINPTPAPNSENMEPTVPNLIAPEDGLLCTDNPLSFSWSTATDPQGDSITYEIQVATNNSFSSNLQSNTSSGTTTNFTLLKGVAYYWRVRAKDNKNNSSSYSTIRKYYTEGEGVSNYLPYAATLIKPELNTTIIENSTSLEWSSSDVDNDPLIYDIYFGNVNPPPLVEENSAATNYTVTLETNTIYYWKINTKDDQEGKAIGQVWSFQTQ